MYCSSRVCVQHTFIISKCEVWECGCINKYELKEKWNLLFSSAHFRYHPLLVTLPHTLVYFLALPLFICLLWVWQTTGDHSFELYLIYVLRANYRTGQSQDWPVTCPCTICCVNVQATISRSSCCSFAHYICAWETCKMGHHEAFEKWAKETIKVKNPVSKGLTRSEEEELGSKVCVGQSQDCPNLYFTHNTSAVQFKDCAANPKIVTHSLDLRFAQDNNRIVQIHTLCITCTKSHIEK